MTFTLNIDKEIASLKTDIVRMASLCEKALYFVSSLVDGKERDLRDIQELSDQIEKSEREIEQECMRILLRRHPVAKDLRSVSAALRIITDLERIGDQADDIGEMISYTTSHSGAPYELIKEMGLATKKMVRDSIDAFVAQDKAMAEAVIKHDDVVDDLFVNVKRTVIDDINRKTIDGEFASDVLMIAKYFERIGDHAVNVAEWVEFSITGHHRREGEV